MVNGHLYSARNKQYRDLIRIAWLTFSTSNLDGVDGPKRTEEFPDFWLSNIRRHICDRDKDWHWATATARIRNGRRRMLLLIFRCRWGAPGHLWSSIGCSGVKWRICKNHFLKVLLKGLLKVGIIYVSGWAVLHNFLGARLNTLLRPFHWRGELDSQYFPLIVEVVHVLDGTFRFDPSIVSNKRDSLWKSCVFVVQDPCRNYLAKAPEEILDFRERDRSRNSSDVQVCILDKESLDPVKQKIRRTLIMLDDGRA